jgi:hypothetical protein
MKVHKPWLFIALICLSLLSESIHAYEVATHADLSQAAYQSSVLGDQDFLKTFGISISDAFDRGRADPNPPVRNDGTARGWIRQGAVTEDDDTRSLNHFYDPIAGTGLQFGVFLGNPSPDWALEYSDTHLPLRFSDQDFSYRDARNYFYRGLTLPTEEERSNAFGRLFEGLGHVIHHVQDMAQPQHVRNDMHCDQFRCKLLGFHNPSFYEQFTDDHRGELLRFQPELATFGQPRDFWTNAAGTGIAQFTNRNFVSAGTNFVLLNGQPSPGTQYALPEPILTSDLPVDVQDLFAEIGLTGPTDPAGNPLHGDIVFVASHVDGALNPRASTYSLFDQDLRRYQTVVVYPGVEVVTTERLFTLNRFNFYAAYPFLIPKAVGYSAGLIDYFFRGRIDLDIDYDSTTAGQYVIRNESDEDMHGAFTLYYDAVDGKRYALAGDAPDITWKDVSVPKHGTSPSLTPPILPDDPKPSRPDEYFLVFKGQMGQEKPLDDGSVGAVAAKSKRKLLWEPWRQQLTDNHPWRAGAGTVNHQVGPNSQTLQNGHLVLFSGVGGAGFVQWQAAGAEDAVASRFMKIRLDCSQSALTEDFNVFGYLSVGPDLFRSQTIPFAGGVGASSSPYNLFPRATEQQEYVIDLGRIGIAEVGYLDINTIGFDQDLTCAIDYIDFSDRPFTQVATGAIEIP